MKNVKEVLLETRRIPELAIRSAEGQYGDDTEAIWRHFVSKGTVTETDVFQALARVNKIHYVDLKSKEVSSEALAILTSAFCRKENLIPIEVDGEKLIIGTPYPNNFRAMDEISASTYHNVILTVVSPSDLQDAFDRYLRSDEEIGKLSEEIEQFNTEDEEDDETVNIEDESPVVRFVNLLIAQAIQDRASDIHVEPGERELRVRYRIDGVLHEFQKADKSIQKGVVSRLKVMSDIDIGERRKPQDGRLTVRHAGNSIDIRVVTLPTTWGEKVVMRILDHSTERRSITSIGMSPQNEEVFKKCISKPHGMILVTGPTGSGKSTTIYTALDEVANPEVNVVTVEDPVEKKIPGVSQMQINNKAGMTFSNALRSILRADPDIIFLGEIRDEETAKIAVDASMTGHLVLSTLHTNGAPEAAARLTEMGVEPYLVGSSVSCVVAQRLARKLCSDCKLPMDADSVLFSRIDFPYPDATLYKAVGCKLCSNTGYRGRVALTEVMEMNEHLEPLIIEQKTANEIRHEAEKHGFTSLRNDGWDKVRQGLTTIEEVLRVSA